MADAIDAAELLDVDMDEFAGQLALIPDDRRSRRQCREPAETSPSQHDANGGQRPANLAGYGWPGQTLPAQGLYLLFRLLAQPGRAATRSGRAIGQTSLAFGDVAIAPFAHRLGRDALCCGDGGDGPPGREALDDQHSTMMGGARIIVDVHPRPPGRGCRCGNHSLSAQPRRDNLCGSYS